MKKLFMLLFVAGVFACMVSAGEWELFDTIPNLNPQGSAAADASNVWFMGGNSSSGAIYRFDGTSWAKEYQAFYDGDQGELRGAYALDVDHVWTVGRSSVSTTNSVFFRDAGSWSKLSDLPSAVGTYVYDVYASDPSNVWLCAMSGNIIRSTNGGLDWAIECDVGSAIMSAIDGLDSQHIWAVGSPPSGSNVVYFYDGSAWSTQAVFKMSPSRYLRDVHARSVCDVWIAGDEGFLAHFNGETWSTIPIDGCTNTINVAIVDSWNGENVWLGYNGVDRGLYFYDGAHVTFSTNINTVYGLVCSGPGDVWAAGSFGNIYRNHRPLAVVSVSRTTAISWTGIVGATYDIEWADDLLGPWAHADTVRAGSVVCTWADLGGPGRPEPSSETERVYRIVLTKP